VCNFNVTQITESVDGGTLENSVSFQFRFEDGEWKQHSATDEEYEPPPDWAAVNEAPALAALEQFYRAVSDFDADGAVAASTEQSASFVRQDVEFAYLTLSKDNPTWWRIYTVTSIDEIECEQFVCDLQATINLESRDADLTTENNKYQLRFESGDWKFHAFPELEYEPPTN
jgi:hypothetical protein